MGDVESAKTAVFSFGEMCIAAAANGSGTVNVLPAISVNPPTWSTPFLPFADGTNDMTVGWQGTGTLNILSGTGNPTSIDRNPKVGVLTVGGGTDGTNPGGVLNGASLFGGMEPLSWIQATR